MVYTLNGPSIFITNHRSITVLQDRNPETQDSFKDTDEAREWGCKYICDFLGQEEIKLIADFFDAEGNAAFEFTKDELITIKLTGPENLNCTVNVDIVNDKEIKKEEFVFENGIAVKKIVLDTEGTYFVQFNEYAKSENNIFHAMHEASLFSITIV